MFSTFKPINYHEAKEKNSNNIHDDMMTFTKENNCFFKFHTLLKEVWKNIKKTKARVVIVLVIMTVLMLKTTDNLLHPLYIFQKGHLF